MPNLLKVASLGIVSSTALLLGACSSNSPGYSGHSSYNHATYTTHHAAPTTHYRAATTTTFAPTTYRPRTTYAARPTVISRSAPYGSSVHYGAPRSYAHTGLRPAAYTYGSIGGVLYDVDQEAAGIQARLGYQTDSILGAEVEGSIGVLDDDETVGLVTTETDYDYSIAGFGTARLPISPQISLLGRGGYHATRIEQTVGLATTQNTRDGFAYGAGAEYALNGRDSLRLDYTVYEVPGSDLDALSLGYQRKF